MSFNNYKDVIEEGDLVFAWISRGLVKPIRINSTETLNTRYGIYPHKSMIGQRFGSQIASNNGLGFIYLLHPTPELWTVSLPHRTQIVYSPDSSFITQKLNITPGSRVIEAGTGSGSFTHSLYRTVGDKGKLFTYEFHKVRQEQALAEFQDHGLDKLTLTHRDVCKNGFEVEGEQVNADAIFLDLPAPWLAIPNLDKVINPELKVAVCCFSPCIEQVEKTIHALNTNGWNSIELVEINHKRWESHKNMVKRVDDVVTRLRDIQQRKKEGLAKMRREKEERLRNEQNGGVDNKNSAATVTAGEKRTAAQALKENGNEDKKDSSAKRNGFNPFGKGQRINQGDPSYEWREVSKDEAELKSHTSFLTFAFKQPAFN